MSSEPITLIDRGAFRTRLVARLIGVPESRLRNWHSTLLQQAHIRAGQRGVPRLYSWRDYHRLLVFAKLIDAGVTTRKIREAIGWLDTFLPDWYLQSLARYDGKAPSSKGSVHVGVLRPDGTAILADASGQISFRDLPQSWEATEFRDVLGNALDQVVAEGPLGRLSRFADVVSMRPEINAGLPTLRGSRLETRYLAELVALSSEDAIAELYDLDKRDLGKIVEFEKVAA